jgi:mono/diheme cytochrome c family protein
MVRVTGVIGTIIFILAFIAVGVTVVLVAMRGRGPAAGEESRPDRAKARAWGIAMAVLLIVLGIGVPALAIVDNSDNSQERGPHGVDLTSAQANGRQLFRINCATCHTLKASNAVGRMGPNLDQLNGGNLQPAFVLDAIEKGRARGMGNMPAGLLAGQDAKDVAAYVSAVAGR